MTLRSLAAAVALCVAASARDVPRSFFVDTGGGVWRSHGGSVAVEAERGLLIINGSVVEFCNGRVVAVTAEAPAPFRHIDATGQQTGRIATTLRIPEVWPGVDARLAWRAGQLKLDWLLAPGASPRSIRFRTRGAAPEVRADGDLALGPVRMVRPVAWQGPAEVAVRWQVDNGGWAGFDVGAYNPALPLEIDPYVVTWATNFGGTGLDVVRALAVDSTGAVYLAGHTDSVTTFPTSVRPRKLGTEAFLLKWLPGSQQIAWATYLGGSGYETAAGVAVDGLQNVWVTGPTNSSDFPQTLAQLPHGDHDVFLLRLKGSDGSLAFSSLYGGALADRPFGIAVEPSGNVWIAGETKSPDFPVAAPLQSYRSGTQDAFVMRLNSAGAVLFSTYWGGSGSDSAHAVALDPNGEPVFTGSTDSADFPLRNAAQATRAGPADAFVSRLAADGNAIRFSTYLGGTLPDGTYPESGNAIAIDPVGNAWIAGGGGAPAFPTAAPVQAGFGGGSTDAFIARYNRAGVMTFSSLWGGNGFDEANAITIAQDGTVLVGGYTSADDLPVVDSNSSASALADGFFLRLATSPVAVLWSGYFGGPGTDSVEALAAFEANLYVAGTADVRFLATAPMAGMIDSWLAAIPVLSTYNVTITPSPASGSYSVSGQGCAGGTWTGAQTLSWVSGSNCTVTPVASAVVGSSRYRFLRWSDNSTGASQTFQATASLTSIGLYYATDYLLTRAVSPAGAGSIGAVPDQGDNWYPSGTTVQLSATAAAGYAFSSWTGASATGAITMDRAQIATANFSCLYALSATSSNAASSANTLSIDVTTATGCGWTVISNSSWVSVTNGTSRTGAGTVAVAVSLNGGVARTGTVTVAGQTWTIQQAAGAAGVTIMPTASPATYTISGVGCEPGSWTGTRTFQWTLGSTCSVTPGGPVVVGAARYRFVSWSDNGTAPSRSFAVNSSLTAVQLVYATDYQLTTAVSPSGGGTITASPASTDGWYQAGTAIQLSATPSAGYAFSSWSGASAGGAVTLSSSTLVMANFGCLPSLFVTASNIVAASAVLSTDVITGAGCAWSASSNVPWISVSNGTGRSGSGSLNATVAANTGVARTGTVTVSGLTWTIQQSAGAAGVTIMPSVAAAPYTVSGSGCGSGTWSGARSFPWTVGLECTITPVASTISGSTRYRFVRWADNSTSASRTFTASTTLTTISLIYATDYQLTTAASPSGSGSVSAYPAGDSGWYAAGTEVQLTGTPATGYSLSSWSGASWSGTVTMSAAASAIANFTCAWTLSSASTLATSAADTLKVDVTTGSACGWTVSSNASWMTVTNGSGRTGSGSVLVNVSANTDIARTGTVTVAGQTWTIQQSAGVAGVTVMPSVSGVAYTVSGSGCDAGTYTGARTFSWLAGTNCTITAAASTVSGSTRWRFARWGDHSTASSRTFTASPSLTSVEVIFTTDYLLSRAVSPANAGSVTASPESADGWYAAGTGVQLTASAGPGFAFAGWSGAPAGGAVTMNAGTSATANFSCTESLSSTWANVSASAGSSSIDVVTGAGCRWSAVSNASWITVSNGTGRSGSGDVSVSFQANPSVARTGTVTIAGQTWTVQQGAGVAGVTVWPSVADAPYAVSGTGCDPGTFSGVRTFQWIAGSNCTITPAATTVNGGTRWRFLQWSDGSTAGRRSFTAGPALTSIELTFATDYLLTRVIAPASSGSISASPDSADGWYSAGSVIQLSASSATGYAFSSWAGTSASGLLTLNAPAQATANFACTWALSASSSSISSSAATLSTDVTTGAGCAWTVASNASWINVSGGTSRTGSGAIAVSVDANNDAPRTGSLTMGGRTWTIQQSAGTAGVTVVTSGATGTYTVAGMGCEPGTYTGARSFSWTAGVTCSVTPAGSSVSGSTRVRFVRWFDNSTAGNRSFAAGPSLTSVEIVYATDYLLTLAADPANAGIVNASPSSPDGWYSAGTAVQLAAAPASGYLFSAWAGAPASGAITMNGPMSVTAAFHAACGYALSTSSSALGAAGGSFSVSVATSASCGWTSTSNAEWIAITTGGGSRTGPGAVTIAVEPNSAATPRSGTVTVAGKTWTIAQEANGCTITTDLPAIGTIPAAGQSYSLNLNATGSSCANWPAIPLATWIELNPLTGGPGITKMTLTAYPNFGTTARTGKFQAGAQVFSVTQAASGLPETTRFLQLAYFGSMGRLPTDAEVASWTAQMAAGLTRADMIWKLFNDDEFNVGSRFIAGLYVGILDRDPEYGGWRFQRAALRNKIVDQTTIVGGFLQTPEYNLRWGNPTAAEFVRLMYKYILLRDATDAEVAWQVGNLGSAGISERVGMARNFLNSNEFKIGAGPRLSAFLLYAAVLARDGGEGERSYMADAIKKGVSVAAMIAGYVESPEFLALLK